MLPTYIPRFVPLGIKVCNLACELSFALAAKRQELPLRCVALSQLLHEFLQHVLQFLRGQPDLLPEGIKDESQEG